jgi:hypothetical protein
MMRNRMVPLLDTCVTSTFGLLDVDVPLWPRAYGGDGAQWSCTWEDVRCDNFFSTDVNKNPATVSCAQ